MLEKILEVIQNEEYLRQDHRESVSRTDYIGRTVLHLSAGRGNIEDVELLCRHYPDLLYITDNAGRTALHLAAHHGHTDIVAYLYQNCRKLVGKIDNYDCTPRDDAKNKGCQAAFVELSGSGSKKTLQNILESNENLLEGVSLPPEMSNLICAFTGSLFGGHAILDHKKGNENFQDLDRKSLAKRIEDYLSWSKKYASGTRCMSRFSHFYHGGSGRKRACILLTVVQNEKSDNKVLDAVKKAIQCSGEAKHSLSRYLISALSKIGTVDYDMNRGDFAYVKSKWLKSR